MTLEKPTSTLWSVVCCLVAVFMLAWCMPALSQVMGPEPETLEEFNRNRIALNHTGMAVLMGWSVLNVGAGLAGTFTGQGRWSSFHQMNAGWGLINLGIASFGLWDLMGQDPSSFTALESLQAAEKMEKVLLLNAGLDVAYMTAGAWMWHHGRKTRSTRLEGFGPSVMLQGAFLLAFDVALWWFNYEQNQSFYLTF